MLPSHIIHTIDPPPSINREHALDGSKICYDHLNRNTVSETRSDICCNGVVAPFDPGFHEYAALLPPSPFNPTLLQLQSGVHSILVDSSIVT